MLNPELTLWVGDRLHRRLRINLGVDVELPEGVVGCVFVYGTREAAEANGEGKAVTRIQTLSTIEREVF